MAMIVKEKNAGEKIPYTIKGSKITFDDELMVNVQRFERDDPAHIDICRDRFGNLVTGVIPGYAESYVAQIDIPARAYIETPIDTGAPEMQAADTEEEAAGGMIGGGSMRQTVKRDAVEFDMSKCTLTLWAINEEV